MKYFKSLFTSHCTGSWDRLLIGVQWVVSDEDNSFLLDRFTEEEVYSALQSIGPTKAPGFDGYPAFLSKILENCSQ